MSYKALQKNMILVGVILGVTIISYQYFHSIQIKYLAVDSFKACVDAGFKVITTYPEKCVMPGKSFINPLQEKINSTTDVKVEDEGNDFKDITYTISGQHVLLKNGKVVLPPNPTLKQSTTTFQITGEPLFYDINGDTKQDVVFLLKKIQEGTQQDAYYVAVALALNKGYVGVNALYVDTSIVSSAFLYKNGEVLLGYTTHTATTTVQQKYFTFTNDILKETLHK